MPITNYMILIFILIIPSLIISQDKNNEISEYDKLNIPLGIALNHIQNTQIDSLLENDYFYEINKKHNATLGRDSVPKLQADISKITLLLRKPHTT